MKKLLLTTVLLLFSCITFGQRGAKIEFNLKDDTIDYGKVYRGEDSGIRIVEFKNTGDSALIITNIQSTCGCTVPTTPKEPIMPGKSGQFEVKYNMNPGPIRKTITVESNAINYEKGQIPIKIKGEVLEKEVVSPLEKKKTSPMQ